MFKKISTPVLVLVLVVLAGLAVINKYYLSEKSESTFNEEFVRIDTGLVAEILIYPHAEKGIEIKLTRREKGWEAGNGKVKSVADSSAIKNLLASFAEIKSNALAGTDKSSWRELQVDDSGGSRILFKTTANKTYDLVVGKFGYNASSQNGVSYIRHMEEEAVYAVEGFLSFAVNQPFSAWRNRIFLKGNRNDWKQLAFTYPGDSSFVLTREGTGWSVNGQNADSAKTEQYLESISSLQSSGFIDSYTPATTPVFNLIIQGNNQSENISITAYPSDSTRKFVLHSSLNPEGWFSESQSQLMGKIFLGRENFLSN